jgi:hypothetical protein
MFIFTASSISSPPFYIKGETVLLVETVAGSCSLLDLIYDGFTKHCKIIMLTVT